MTLDEILERLPDARRSGDTWMCRCPAHEDRSPSLSVSAGASVSVILKCHAGCSPEDVVAALGLSMSDLFERRNGSGPAGFVVDEYEYVDEHGNLLYVVERLAPKAFLQKRPTPDGWEYRVQGVRKVPYRLPRVLAHDGWIVLVEGEKDVHAAERLGFVAMTWAGGAQAWKSEYADYLKGRSVVLIADEDKAGQDLLPRQLGDLERAGAKVRHVRLGVKDLSDWVAAGHSGDELRALVRGAAPPMIGAEVSEMGDVPAPRLIVPGLLPVGLTVLAGAPKSGKSFLAGNVAVGLASGGLVLGIPVNQLPVLALFLEDGKGRAKHRLDTMAGGESPKGLRVVAVEDGLADMKNGGLALVEQTATVMGAGLIIIDTFGRFAGQEYSGNVYRGEYREWNALKELGERVGACVLVLTHDAKGAQGEWMSSVSGTRATTGAADAVMLLSRKRGTPNATLKVTGREIEDVEYALCFDGKSYVWRNLGDHENYRHVSLAMKIEEIVVGEDPWSPSEVAAELEEPRDAVTREMSRMARSGRLVKTGFGRYKGVAG